MSFLSLPSALADGSERQKQIPALAQYFEVLAKALPQSFIIIRQLKQTAMKKECCQPKFHQCVP